MRVILLAAFAALVLCGCGGGGGGGGLSLSLPREPLKASLFPGQLPAVVTSTAKVKGSTSASTIYVFIIDPAGTFMPGGVNFYQDDEDDFTAELRVSPGLSIGVHAGTLEVRVCADAECNSLLTSARRAYEITIKPPEVRGMADTLRFALDRGNSRLNLGFRLEGVGFGRAVYAAATDADGRFSGVPVRLESTSSESFNWPLPWQTGQEERTHAGNLTLKFCYDAACATPFTTKQVAYRVQVFSEVNTFCCSRAVAVDDDQNVYTAQGDAIVKLTPEGVATIPYFDDGEETYARPEAVAVNSAGAVFFSQDSGPGIERLNADASPSHVSNAPAYDMAFGKNGLLYLAQRNLNRVVRLVPGSEPQAWGASFALDHPVGISVDSSGTAYVAEARGIVAIAADGASRFLSPLPDAQIPTDVAAASSGSVLVTTEFGVYRITAAGVVETIVAPETILSPSFPYHFAPASIARTEDGKVYISGMGRLFFTRLP